MEFYILTFCSAPGRIPDLFNAFLPRDAHPRTPTVVLNLSGWQCEVGRELKAFREGILRPDLSLLIPLCVTVFPNIPRRHTFQDLCARLSTDGQDLSSAFLQHDPRGTMALYVTDGITRYQPTAAFLRLTPTTTRENPDIPDLAGVRECYRLMGQPTGSLALRHSGRTNTPVNISSYKLPPTSSPYANAVARVNPSMEEAMTQISSRREPMLLDRANNLIVQHLRPLENQLVQQEAIIRDLDHAHGRANEQGPRRGGVGVRAPHPTQPEYATGSQQSRRGPSPLTARAGTGATLSAGYGGGPSAPGHPLPCPPQGLSWPPPHNRRVCAPARPAGPRRGLRDS